ncbi:hypothetical protein [Burkholderia ubonensis]|nr:hypothetical protein [Burkholderia ubonensis]
MDVLVVDKRRPDIGLSVAQVIALRNEVEFSAIVSLTQPRLI